MSHIYTADCCLDVRIDIPEILDLSAKVTVQDIGYGQQAVIVEYEGLTVTMKNYDSRFNVEGIEVEVLEPAEEEDE